MEAILNFLNNTIIINWIAPIVSTIVAAIIVKLFLERQKSKTLISINNIANKKLIDSIRPFLIQEIEIDSNIIEDIRKAIMREYNLESNMLYSTSQLKQQIVLDVAETRYLTEDKKYELINFIYKMFYIEEVESITALEEGDILTIKKEKARLYVNSIGLAISLATLIIATIVPILFKIKIGLINNVVINDTIITVVPIAMTVFAVFIAFLENRLTSKKNILKDDD